MLWATFLTLAPASQASTPKARALGVEVQSSKITSLEVGDRIVGWAGSGRAGSIDDPIDWLEFEIEHAPRGGFRLEVRRRGELTRIEIVGTAEGLEVSPIASAGMAAESVRSAAWDHFEAARGEALRDAASLDLDRHLPAIDRLEAGDSARLRIRLAAALDRHQDTHRALALLEGALDSLSDPAARRVAPLTRAACQSRIGRLLRRLGELGRAAEILDLALASQQELAPESLAIARTWNELGAVAVARGELVAAEAGFRKAFEIRSRLSPQSPDTALSLNNLGLVAELNGDHDQAEQLYKAALARQEASEPDSLDLATTLNNLGIVASKRGDLDTAEQLFRRSLSIKEKHQVGLPELADQLNNLGIVNQQRGDLATAESFYRRALEARHDFSPQSLETASSYNNLGWIAALRGDLVGGEQLLLRSLALKQKHAPGSTRVATTLDKLAQIALIRQNPDRAEGYAQRAEEIYRTSTPDSLQRATTLRTFARIERVRRDFAAARSYLNRSNEIIRKTAPQSLDRAIGWWLLGKLSFESEEFELAEQSARQALELSTSIAPETMVAASSRNLLGRIAARKGEETEAVEHFQASLQISERWGLEGIQAESHLELARLYRQTGKADQAVAAYQRGLEFRENYRRSVGGSDLARARYGSAIAEATREYVDLLVDLGHHQRAFEALESYRARSLRDLLSTRDLLDHDLPQGLDSERRRLDAAYDRLLERIATWQGTEDAKSKLQAEAAELERARAENRSQIRAASSKLALLDRSEPLDLSAARRLLGPGTLMLVYAAGESQLHLFAIAGDPAKGDATSDPLQVVSVDIGRRPLRTLVETFRRSIELTSTTSAGPLSDTDVQRIGQRLHELLIAPVGDLVAAADRLLLVPDAALYDLPFGALVTTPGAGKASTEPPPETIYLAQWKPLLSTLSASVLGELRAATKDQQTAYDFVGIADPRLESNRTSQAEGVEQSLEVTRFSDSIYKLRSLEALPGSRQELREIAALYDPRQTRLLLADEATETQVRSAAQDARILHFATHGLIDPRAPLDSALVLSAPGQVVQTGSNGLLQAWEILEDLRLSAQLVVLSACETGLGEELSGEGLYGLVRAFQFAGARSVVASLWSVADTSTSTLMQRFHAGVAEGLSLDEALQEAQRALIAGAAGELAARPYYWAGFQLYGDWLGLNGLRTSNP